MNGRDALLGVSLLATLLSGCTVGPNYKKPAVPTPAGYRGSPEPPVQPDAASFGDQKWWDAFQDDALRDLIRASLQQNYDVRIAAARIVQARALLGITQADQLPEISAGVSAVNQRLPQSPGRPPIETSATQVGLSAAWELDFWGKYRRATESARANLLSEEWAQRHIVSSLVSDVAAAYFQLREQDLELEISRQTLASRTDSLRLTQVLADRGATSLLDVRQANNSSSAPAPRSPISNSGSNSRRTSSASSWEETPRASFEAGVSSISHTHWRFQQDFRRRCSSGARTSSRRSNSWSRQMRKLASPRRPTSRTSR